MKRLLAGVFTMVAVFGAWSKAEAFEIRPAIQELRVRAGESIERDIQLSNPSTEPARVFFTIQAFEAAGGGKPRFLPPEASAGLPEWVKVSAPAVQLAPGGQASVRVHIEVPATAPTGSYTAAIFATESSNDGVMVEVSKRIATLWFVAVQGTDGVSAAPAWTADIRSVQQHPELVQAGVQLAIKLGNRGTVHGIGVAEISSAGVFTAATSSLLVARLLPNEARTFLLETRSRAPLDRVHIRVRLPSGESTERVAWIISPLGVMGLGLVLIGAVYGIWRWRMRRRGILTS